VVAHGRAYEVDSRQWQGPAVSIRYTVKQKISPADFVDVLRRSTLADRRPVDDSVTIQGVVENSNLLVGAWDGGMLVDVARSMTDFHYACYLSDLAVDQNYQCQGIGRALLQETSGQLSEKCKLILVSAPAADDYYPRLGFEKNDRTWVLPRGKKLTD
jgi:ribosomal protein S18 acetylase RimI-like enzyme